MQKNWYMIYVKLHAEKKVAASLRKKKIDGFCPVICQEIKRVGKTRLSLEPLFISHLFVYLKEVDLRVIEGLKNVISIVHWLNKPAIIKPAEIEIIKEFARIHRNIKITRTLVNPNVDLSIISNPPYFMDGNIASIINDSITVNLPSLGFTMTAEIERENLLEKKDDYYFEKKLSNNYGKRFVTSDL